VTLAEEVAASQSWASSEGAAHGGILFWSQVSSLHQTDFSSKVLVLSLVRDSSSWSLA